MPRSKIDNTSKIVKPTRKFIPEQSFNEKSSNSPSFEDFIESTSDSMKNGVERGNNEVFCLDFGGGMTKLLEQCYSNMDRTLQAKRKSFEQFTGESAQSTTKTTNKDQSVVVNHFKSLFFAMIQQFESELEKIKDVEKEMQKLLDLKKYQMQVRNVHLQRLEVLKNLSDEFSERIPELEENHAKQYSAVYRKLRNEIAVLQKKNLMEMQQKDVMKFRKLLKEFFD